MAKLDWRMDERCIWAKSSRQKRLDGTATTYDVFRKFEGPSHDRDWTAHFGGQELARGTLPDCLDACEASELTEARQRAVDLRAAAPHGPDRVSAGASAEFWANDDLEPATAAELIEKSGQPNMLTPGESGLPYEIADVEIEVPKAVAERLSVHKTEYSQKELADAGLPYEAHHHAYVLTIKPGEPSLVALRACSGPQGVP